MSDYCLEVYDGRSQLLGTYPISDGANRVGGDAGCNVCIKGLPQHALTLREVDGVFMVFNRLDQPILMGELPLKPRQSAPWSVDGAILRIGQIGLRLTRQMASVPLGPAIGEDVWGDIGQDPPPEDPFYFGKIEPRRGERIATPSLQRRKQLQIVQIVVIFSVLAVLVYFTFFEPTAGGPETKAVSFTAALKATDSLYGDQAVADEVRGRLQDAYAARSRGDVEEAKRLLIAVRDRLPVSAADEQQAQPLETLRRYVLQTLAAADRQP